MADQTELLRKVLERNRREVVDLSTAMGRKRTRALLARAESELVARLHKAEGLKGPGKDSFTAAQLNATLRQIRDVSKTLQHGMKGAIVGQAGKAADMAAGGVIDYLRRADKAFRGVGTQPLAIKEAAILDAAVSGAQSSVLRRLASSGEPIEGADDVPHPAKQGILERYGIATVEYFEKALQEGLLTRASWAEVRAKLIEGSPFLQAAPAYWAERIVCTETMGASNRASWESTREADSQLGDVVKILSATFDDRTAADSYAVHGQIRRSEEAFETWFGLMQHPPARPNDREIVTPHRLAWPIPPALKVRPWEQVIQRWHAEGRKGAPPPRPRMTTVPYGRFGHDR